MAGASPSPEGAKVRLRLPGERDLDLLSEWYRDPERASPFDRFSIDTREGLAASLRDAASDNSSLAPRFMIERRSDGVAVGCVGHYRTHPVLAILEVGYLVGDPTARGAGLGSEAVGLLVDHLFRTTEFDRVGAVSDVENVASYRLLEKLGFHRDGVFPATLHHHGRWHDAAVYGVTRSAWRRP
jgi:RimJ/RimL family protein N-acetyltransferase